MAHSGVGQAEVGDRSCAQVIASRIVLPFFFLFLSYGGTFAGGIDRAVERVAVRSPFQVILEIRPPQHHKSSLLQTFFALCAFSAANLWLRRCTFLVFFCIGGGALRRALTG